MATTTLKLIREQWATLLQALTPSSLIAQKFREYKDRKEFRDWSEDSPSAALRRFFIEDGMDYELPLSSNMDDEEITTEMTLMVAYPKDGRYGSGEGKTMRDVMREDMHQIDTALGHRGIANYVSGQNLAEANDKTISKGDAVDFLAMTYEINFRRAF